MSLSVDGGGWFCVRLVVGLLWEGWGLSARLPFAKYVKDGAPDQLWLVWK
jgi:hypothetical protein